MATLYQCAHTSIFDKKLYDGQFSIRDLKKRGTLGLGTFHALNGELIALDGQFYQCKEGKNNQLAADDSLVPWAAVSSFTENMQTKQLLNLSDISVFESKLLEHLDTGDGFYAFHIQGKFNRMTFRSVLKQTKPYASLEEVSERCITEETGPIEADLVGFHTPKFMNSIKPAGLHLHGISQDKSLGGHVLALDLKQAKVCFERITNFHMDLIPSAS